MRIILCLAVFGILAAIWFGWKKAKSEVEKEKTPNSKFSSGWDAQIIAVIAAWSVMCAIIGGLLARCTEKPSKEVTLTVVDKAADKDSVTTYFRHEQPLPLYYNIQIFKMQYQSAVFAVICLFLRIIMLIQAPNVKKFLCNIFYKTY